MSFFNRKKYQQGVPTVPKSMWRNPLHFIAFGFGAGALPVAPGTFGTVVGVLFYLLLAPLPWFYYLLVVTVITLVSMWISDRVAKEIKVHDHQGMCLDEIVGYLVTMINAPRGWVWILIGFALFRFFDICKPWPIRWVDEKVHGGFGIIIDDVIAGLFSMAIIQILAWVYL